MKRVLRFIYVLRLIDINVKGRVDSLTTKVATTENNCRRRQRTAEEGCGRECLLPETPNCLLLDGETHKVPRHTHAKQKG